MSASAARLELAAALALYGRHHRTSRNRLVHYFCIPAIMFSLIGILLSINFGLTLIGIAAAILYYNRFGPKIAMQMGAVMLIMLAGWITVMPAHHLPALALSLFVLGWTGQFLGHIHEGSRPSFMEDVRSLLTGPVFVLTELQDKLARLRLSNPP